MDNLNNQTNYRNAPEYMLWFVLGVIQISLICSCSLTTSICGIITVVKALKANNYFKYGEYSMYKSSLRSSKVANILGWAALVLKLVIVMVIGVFENLLVTLQ